jgi:hypothetical protein
MERDMKREKIFANSLSAARRIFFLSTAAMQPIHDRLPRLTSAQHQRILMLCAFMIPEMLP